jgi:hypothetical protein
LNYYDDNAITRSSPFRFQKGVVSKALRGFQQFDSFAV